MKRIVKRTTTTEEWVDPGDKEREQIEAADEDDTEHDDDADESEDQDDEHDDEPRPARRGQ